MSIDCMCDDCGEKIDAGDDTICRKCFDYANNRIEELEKELDELRAELAESQKKEK